MKNGFLENKGITLLALIITIVVLLILSVISISMIVGEDGVIMRARMAEEEQRYVEIAERKDLWWSHLKLATIGNSKKVQKLKEFIEELENNGVITGAEKEKIYETGQLEFDLIGKNIPFFAIRGKNRKICKISR